MPQLSLAPETIQVLNMAGAAVGLVLGVAVLVAASADIMIRWIDGL